MHERMGLRHIVNTGHRSSMSDVTYLIALLSFFVTGCQLGLIVESFIGQSVDHSSYNFSLGGQSAKFSSRFDVHTVNEVDIIQIIVLLSICRFSVWAYDNTTIRVKRRMKACLQRTTQLA